MSLDKKDFSTYIKQFNFRELFNDMGWNNDKTVQPIVVDNETYTLQAVAEKSGFKILLCNPLSNGLIPDYNTRKKIETKVTKLFQEHLIIFFDTKNTEQIWQLVVRQSGKPTKVTETRWHINQDPELLYQRAAGIFFELDEEDKITIVDVKKRMGDNFQQNNEKVTKQFYDKFKKEHSSFLQFIKGISDKANQDWYASLMLNRLMFCYFIQKKGFLDNNKNYLRDKLKACTLRQAQGDKSKKFYSFYRDFLLVLFHKGLNEPTQNQDVKIEIGKIPYLNGGLFDEHELEKTHTEIDINDKAFEQLFNFFDQYEWHLETSVTATGKDINPDVIGYIFEKYINDRANMGAYYTKEDITDYIGKNCIIPFLFDETARNLKNQGNLENLIKITVQTSGDKYIYDAVKKGIQEPLPKEIEQGIKEVSKRTEWNKPATINYALPTEIWREVVDRRNRYTEVKTKIDKGEINTINNFITYNLNIRQFAQDVVENTNDPELLKHFYKALNSVTIIDPTCGSGAFLFAAMNILEPLYEACIVRMERFVYECEDDRHYKHLPADLQKSWQSIKSEKSWFRQVLAQVKSPEHPNLQYFIYKSIILRNLYGVDIMKEAVEIAKLRLFLKLVATVEADYRKPNLGLEPLPDIDFNIRAGNTLIGFATEAELQKGLTYTLDGAIAKPLIEEKCEIVANAFKRYKEIQLTYGDDFKEFKKAKAELNKRLNELNHELNQLLHKQASGLKYDQWLKTHQPFHWFAEFYEIIQGNGGFDVVIGNPPYVEYSKVRENYKIKNFVSEKCGNLYAFVMEQSLKIAQKNSSIGFIIPISITTTPRMETINKLYEKGSYWVSNFAVFPQSLFTDVHQRISIVLSKPSDNKKVFTTKYNKWFSNERENLVEKINYSSTAKGYLKLNNKIGDDISLSIINKIYSNKKTIGFIEQKGSNYCLYYKSTGINSWLVFSSFAPNCKINGLDTPSSRETHFYAKNLKELSLIGCLLNSSIFYLFYTFNTNCRDLNPSDVRNFNFPEALLNQDFTKLFSKINENFENNSKSLTRNQKQTGVVEIQSFRPREAKPIIDEIDTVLAKHYGFTEEELDFIINYDIKYRMGKELENEDEE